jgi:hypothetical protein
MRIWEIIGKVPGVQDDRRMERPLLQHRKKRIETFGPAYIGRGLAEIARVEPEAWLHPQDARSTNFQV